MEIAYQVLSIIALIFTVLSFQMKDMRKLVAVQGIGVLFWTISFICGKAYAAAAMNGLSFVRCVGFFIFLDRKRREPFTLVISALFIVMAVVSVVCFNELWYIALVVCLASLVGNLFYMLGNRLWYRYAQLGFISPCWLFNNIWYMSIGGITCDCLNMLSVIISLIILKMEKSNTTTIKTKSIYNNGMSKIRLYFPLVEAGMGHIMPANSVIEEFKKKYGNDERIEIIVNKFFGDSTDPACHKYEKRMIDALKSFQKCHAWGYFANWWDTFFWGPKEIAWFTVRGFNPGYYKHLQKRFDEINPDIVFSTHWVTNYLAMNKKGERPYSIMFCPDCRLDRMFSYRSDLKLISTQTGYDLAIGKYGHTVDNFKKVPFCIRNEAFTTEKDKIKLRKQLGLPQNKFTLVVVEGAYGNGRLKAICKSLTKKDIPLTLIAVCGKNPKLVEYLKKLEVHPNVTFVPLGFTPVILNYISASDLYLGKSGNGINESTFFKVPAIITSYTNYIEQYIGEYFINYVGSAQKVSNVKKIARLIEAYANNPELLKPYIDNCDKVKDNYGSEQTADLIYQAIQEQFFNEK